MEEMKNAYNISVGKPERKSTEHVPKFYSFSCVVCSTDVLL